MTDDAVRAELVRRLRDAAVGHAGHPFYRNPDAELLRQAADALEASTPEARTEAVGVLRRIEWNGEKRFYPRPDTFEHTDLQPECPDCRQPKRLGHPTGCALALALALAAQLTAAQSIWPELREYAIGKVVPAETKPTPSETIDGGAK